MKRLTLTLTERDARTAKRLARERGLTVSSLMSDFLRDSVLKPAATNHDTTASSWRDTLPPGVKKALGVAKFSTTKSDRELLEEALAEKYGLK